MQILKSLLDIYIYWIFYVYVYIDLDSSVP